MTRLDRRERQRIIFEALSQGKIGSQHDVVRILAKAGFRVTQATASRDLEELGAVRGKGVDGRTVYSVPEPGRGLIDDLTLGISESQRLLVIKTPPGAAQLIAGRIDRTKVIGVVGTIAGDDTIFVACEKEASVRSIKEKLKGLVAGDAQPRSGTRTRKRSS
ncbi:MAG: arginine repressor [Actinomycetota bacterium]|jgi:transcriptional regulator of arginine metabolism